MKTCPAGIWLLAGLGVIGGCSRQQPPGTTNAAGTQPEVEVRVFRVEPPAAAVYFAPSTLTVEHEADLLAEEQGRLLQVLADEGQRVKRGQPLARLDDSELRKQFEQDQAEMQMLEAEAREAIVMRQAMEVELQRQSDLQKYGLGTKRDYDRARFNLEASRQEIDKAQFDYERAKAKVAADQLRLSKMELKAPFDGIVSRRYANVGQMLLRNDKLLRVTELRPLIVHFTVPEALRHTVTRGALLQVQTIDPPAVEIRARVIRTTYVVDAASGMLDCVAQLLEPFPAGLVPGLAVEVRAPRTDTGTATSLFIPSSAVLRHTDGTAQVFTVNQGRLQQRTVKLGLGTGTSVQVIGGLSPGETIVLYASGQLQNGVPVRIRP